MNKRLHVSFLSMVLLLISSTSAYAQIYTVGNGDGFAFASVGGVGTEVPLPIQLLNFEAYIQNTTVVLEWQTASEINNDFFTVEKSKTGFDWIAVCIVNGAGNSSTILKYNATDPSPFLGVSYYRLKQTDFDGKYKYSPIRAVNFSQSEVEVIIYPNPSINQITIQANKQELSIITIYNNLGQDITAQTKQLSKSDNTVVIDLSALPSGIYTVRTLTTANIVYKQ